jgi:outer membrane protein, heavy metal efflux system
MRTFYLFIFLLLPFLNAFAQESISVDSISLTLNDIEQKFLDKNMALLAQRYNIEENKAYIIQAKIWDLPTVSIEQGVYNRNAEKKWFDISKTGETAGQVQQLISLAGKRNKRIKLAEITAQNAEYQYYDLLRTLRYQLRTDFWDIYYLRQIITFYDQEIPNLNKVINSYEAQFNKGNISLRNIVRLKSLLLSLENERLEYVKTLNENQHELSLMINAPANQFIIPLLINHASDSLKTSNIPMTALIDSALNNRYDLLVYHNLVKYSELDIKYQKSLAFPDITPTVGWDKNGSYTPNYNYFGISFDLPLWNRNKGNIHAAEARLNQSQAQYDLYSLTVNHQLFEAYSKALEIERLYSDFQDKFGAEYAKLFEGVTDTYKKREMGLLEFIDFFESYKDTKSQLLKLANGRMDALEEVNYCTGRIMYETTK